MPNGFNAANRGVYIADNLNFLTALNDECVDLVCIDPPFAKNETFTGDRIRPPLTEAELAIERRLLAGWGVRTASDAGEKGIVWPDAETRGGYRDIWSWKGDIHEDWLDSLEANYPAIHTSIEATRVAHSDGVAAYLCYMAVRLIEIHRVLKPTGSLYLHCDHTANAYLRQLLDTIFGSDNFRDHIVWERTRGRNTGRIWGHTHDTILFYTKSDEYVWNDAFLPVANSKTSYGILTAQGIRSGESGQEWKGYNPTSVGRHWGVPKTGRLADWIDDNAITGYKGIQGIHDRLEALDKANLIRWSDAGVPSIKRPAGVSAGVKINNTWTDIKRLGGSSRERTGYPTQKPVALAERIIATSSNEGDVVLDCFAGCAYAGVAAERLNRRWVACDINPRAWTVFKRQFGKPTLVTLDCNDDVTGQAALALDNTVTVHGPDELPVRETPISETAPKKFVLPEREFKVPASDIPARDMLAALLEWSGYAAWCCGFANRRPDGSVVRTLNNFHLDHIDPKSKRGSNQIWNRAPLCPTHNIRKGSRRVHLSEYRREIADAGEMLVDRMQDLVDLAEMDERAHRFHMDYMIRRGYQPPMGG